jgi:hypothetical protein
MVFNSLHDRTLSFFYGIVAAVSVAASVAVLTRVMSPSVPSLSVNLACPHEHYLTFGSACMDCGYNNQRIDLEHAIQLAAWSNRTLVVRDIVCSPHSPCPRTTNADPDPADLGDSIVPTFGGVARWHALCNAGRSVVVCDKDRALREVPPASNFSVVGAGLRWGTGVGRLPASLFIDGNSFAKEGVRFLWASDFHRAHGTLVGVRAAADWVLLHREDKALTHAEQHACVWHAAHMHKSSTLMQLTTRLHWEGLLKKAAPVVYAGWLQSLAKQTLHAAGLLPADGRSSERAAGSGFVAVHARLGDWARHNGCVNCSFKSGQYARALRQLVDKRTGPTRGAIDGPPYLFLAAESRELPRLKPVLELAGFRVVTSSTISHALLEHATAQLGMPPTEDVISCVEQLICCQANLFVGTPGSTWTAYVQAVRKRAVALPSVSLSPLRFMARTGGALWRRKRRRQRQITGSTAEPAAFAAAKPATLAANGRCALELTVRREHLVAALTAHRRHPIGLLAGTGPSASMPASTAAWLNANTDVWGMNQFFLHPDLVPRFYNLEMRAVPSGRRGKAHTQSSDNSMYWRRYFVEAKRKAYRDTLFLAKEEHEKSVSQLLTEGSPCPKALAVYKVEVEGLTSWPKHRCDAHSLRKLKKFHLRSSKLKNAPPLPEYTVKEYCSSSITRILALMAKAGHSSIATIGIDLNSPDHFYTHTLPRVPFEAAARTHGLKFVDNATIASTGLSLSHHATAFRGVALFLERFSEGVLPVTNLATASMLATSSLRTVPLSEFARG